MWLESTAEPCGANFVFRNRLRLTRPLGHVRKAGSRLRAFFLPLAIGITGCCVTLNSCDCDLVHGVSCCVQDAHYKHVHSAARLIVFMRDQQQRHN